MAVNIVGDIVTAVSKLGAITLPKISYQKKILRSAPTPPPIDSFLKGAPVGGVFDSAVEQAIIFDALLTSTHKSSATITKHPVEAGSNISDHMVKNPDSLTLSVVVTNSPLSVPFGQTADPERAQKAHIALLDMQAAGVAVDVLTTWKKYKSMAITEVSHTIDAKTGGMASLSVTLEEIRTVESQLVTGLSNPQPTQARAQKEVEKGKKATKAVEDTSVLGDMATATTDYLSGGVFTP